MNKIILFFLFLLPLSALALPELKELQKKYLEVEWDKATTTSVIINAPLSAVWKYASDSTKAVDWSVFFAHIDPLPGISDGQIGSLRRCFRNANTNPPYWDEIIILLEPEKMRVITTYNLTGFKFGFLTEGSYVFVRQLYRAIDANRTEMTFQTRYSQRSGLLTKFGFFLAKSDTEDIFKKNLHNIKAAIEGKPRLYPWDPKF